MKILVEIIGIDASDHCYSCKRHLVCGGIVKEGNVLHLALVFFVNDGVEEPAIKTVEVVGGCCIGFARRHLIKHAVAFHGTICRVTELSKDSTSQTKHQLHYKIKGCDFALTKSFRSNKNKEAVENCGTDDNDGTDQNTPPTKKARDSIKQSMIKYLK